MVSATANPLTRLPGRTARREVLHTDEPRRVIDNEDRRLAEGLHTGDPRAMELLYDRYSRRAFGLAYRILNDSARAEDAVQEAFLVVWRQADRIDPARGKPQSFLMTVVHHKAIDILRSERGQSPRNISLHPDIVDDESDTFGKVERTLDQEAAREAVRTALSALPPSQRESIELAYFRGLTHVEIAGRLAVPLGTVKSRLRLGLAEMRSALTTDKVRPSRRTPLGRGDRELVPALTARGAETACD